MPILSAPEVKKVKKEKKAKPAATILAKKMSADVQKWNMKSKELSESAEEPSTQSASEQLSAEQKNKIWDSIKSANALLSSASNAADKTTTVRIDIYFYFISPTFEAHKESVQQHSRRHNEPTISLERQYDRNNFRKCLPPLQTEVQLSRHLAKARERIRASQDESGEVEAGARSKGSATPHARSEEEVQESTTNHCRFFSSFGHAFVRSRSYSCHG